MLGKRPLSARFVGRGRRQGSSSAKRAALEIGDKALQAGRITSLTSGIGESGWGADAAPANSAESCDPSASAPCSFETSVEWQPRRNNHAIFAPSLQFPRNAYFASAGLAASARVAAFCLASDSFTRLVKSPASLCSNPL